MKKQVSRAKSSKEYFHFGKKDHYAKDCYSVQKRKLEVEKSSEEVRQSRWQKWQKTATTRFQFQSHVADSNNAKPYLVRRVFMAKEIKNLNVWYLKSYASRYLCDNKCFYLYFWSKSYKFMTVGEKIIRLEEVGSVHLSTNIGATIALKNVTYILRYNSNLISLG